MNIHFILPSRMFLFLCTVLAVATSKGQTAKPILGKLVVQVPAVLLPSDDYWIYVNSQIVRAPAGKSMAQPTATIHVVVGTNESRREEFWDKDGQVAVSAKGKMTYIRSDWKDRVYESKTLKLSPSNYKVELITRCVDSTGLPFVITELKTQVNAGETSTLTFGIPPKTNEILIPQLSPLTYYNSFTKKLDLTSIVNDFERTTKNFDADPIVDPLIKVLQNMSTTPPSQPGVYMSLPESLGGGREFDLRQLNIIIDCLESRHAFYDQGALAKASDADSQLATLVTGQIEQHNKRFKTFRDIVKVLEKFKRSGGL